MKQQVVVIHGGTSFDTYRDYIEFLKTRELTLERLLQCDDWKNTIPHALGEAFEVLLPKMPNGTNVRYEEWCIWFERCTSFLRDDVILVGQSLGGIFLAKYLAEYTFPKKVKGVVLVAAPFDTTTTTESLKKFVLPTSLEKLASQGGVMYLFYSKDDKVVPFSEMEKYEKVLPNTKHFIFEDRGHFNQGDFPELVELLNSLTQE